MSHDRRRFLELSKFGSFLGPTVDWSSSNTRQGRENLVVVRNIFELSSLGTNENSVGAVAIVLGGKDAFDGKGGIFVKSQQARGTILQDQIVSGQVGPWTMASSFASTTPTASDLGAKGDIKSDDTSSLQTLINNVGVYAGDLGKAGYIPAGLYRLTKSLVPQSYSRIYGDGPHQSVLYNYQNPMLDKPALLASKSLTFSTFEKFGMLSQKSGFDVSGVTDHNTFRDLKLYGMADAGFRFRGPLQTSLFERILFENCNYGIVCDDLVANRNTLREPEFKDCKNSAIKLRGAEDLLIIGGRFEGAGSAGRSIIDVENINMMSFIGGYFERSHEYLLTAKNTSGVISFDSVHFTYFQSGSPYKWNIDDRAHLVFRNCHSTIPMKVPNNAILEGYNVNISK